MSTRSKGFNIIGAIFLLLGVVKLAQGENWIVWIILGVLFGGLGFLNKDKAESE